MRLAQQIRAYFGDETRRRAGRYVHYDLHQFGERMAAYREAADEVRLAVRAILAERVDRASASNASPALSTLMSILGTAGGVVTGLYIAAYSAVLNIATGSETMSSTQLAAATQFVVSPVLWTSTALASLGVLSWIHARRRDRDKAIAMAWLRAYEDSERSRPRPRERERIALFGGQRRIRFRHRPERAHRRPNAL